MKKGKRTHYAKWTSIMRKLDNELEKEKISIKKQFNDNKEKEVKEEVEIS